MNDNRIVTEDEKRQLFCKIGSEMSYAFLSMLIEDHGGMTDNANMLGEELVDFSDLGEFYEAITTVADAREAIRGIEKVLRETMKRNMEIPFIHPPDAFDSWLNQLEEQNED